jgi:hypothetical protein
MRKTAKHEVMKKVYHSIQRHSLGQATRVGFGRRGESDGRPDNVSDVTQRWIDNDAGRPHVI